jgi:Fe-Mn family superoxide dismutase
MKHLLPPLPYALSALEPHIQAHSLAVHHGKHHAGYVEELNQALELAPDLLRGRPAHWLLLNLDQVPESIRATVRHNAGGHLNHSTFWNSMSPGAGAKVNSELGNAIDHSFGSMAKFKEKFEEAGRKLFGSGWVWLAKSPNGDDSLRILTTSGNDNPITQGFYPLLVNDVWEHAYYLQHENRRDEYLQAWWSVANWREAGRRLARAGSHADLSWAANGDAPLVASI